MSVIEVAYLRLKVTGFQRIKLYAEGVSEASKSPRPKARFSQIGHGGGKPNHALRDAKVTVEQRSAVIRCSKPKIQEIQKNSMSNYAERRDKDTEHPSFVPRPNCFVRVAQMGMRTSCDWHRLCNGLPWGQPMALNCITR
jgi:hypothetical protein